MRREATERMYLCSDRDRCTVDADLRFTIDQGAPERAGRLEPGDHHMTLRAAEVLPQVVQDPSAVAHAATGDHQGVRTVGIDGAGLVGATAEVEVVERRHTAEAAAQPQRGSIVAVGMFPIDLARLDRHRAAEGRARA